MGKGAGGPAFAKRLPPTQKGYGGTRRRGKQRAEVRNGDATE